MRVSHLGGVAEGGNRSGVCACERLRVATEAGGGIVTFEQAIAESDARIRVLFALSTLQHAIDTLFMKGSQWERGDVELDASNAIDILRSRIAIIRAERP